MKGKVFWIGGVVVLLLAVGVTFAVAQIENTVYYGCVNEESGTIKVFLEEPECKNNEIAVKWNEIGPQGLPGPEGPTGDQGDQGVPGEDGTSCSVTRFEENGYSEISCTDGTSVIVQDGAQGDQGDPGIHCWDLDNNGVADLEEDINQDGTIDVADCIGPQGPPGPQGDPGELALASIVCDVNQFVSGFDENGLPICSYLTQVECIQDADCDDGDVCTIDTCDLPSGCVFTPSNEPECVDEDRDGYPLSVDCNDGDASINPGALEVCDGVDNDCDEGTMDGAAEVWMGALCDGPDSDSCLEGVYLCESGAQVCTDITGDDIEIPDDGVDNDCDGVVDNVDSDQDGYYSFEDCNDSDPDMFPGNQETCDGKDNNCDGQIDEGCFALSIFADPVEGGVVTPSHTVMQGEDVPIEATATEGHQFIDWSVLIGTGVVFGDVSAASTTVRLEDGPASVQANFDVQQELVDFVLIIDATGSMGTEIREVKDSLKSFVTDHIPMNYDSRFSVVLFGFRPEVVLDFTDDRDRVKHAIDRISTSGPVTGFQFNHNANPDASFEVMRIILGAAVDNRFVGYNGPFEGPLDFRTGAKKVFILATDEDSDRPNWGANYYTGQQFNDPPTSGWFTNPTSGWFLEIEDSADAIINGDVDVYLFIYPGDIPSTYQFGHPTYQVQNADYSDFNSAATLSNLIGIGHQYCLQARLLDAGIVSRVIEIGDMSAAMSNLLVP